MDIYLFSQVWLTFLTPDELKTSLVHSEKILQNLIQLHVQCHFRCFGSFVDAKERGPTKQNYYSWNKNRPHLTQALQINLKKRSVFLCPTSGELLPSELQNHSKTMHNAHWTLHKIGVSFCTEDFQRSFKITVAVAWHNMIKCQQSGF